jgi:hypothetical protein
MIQPPATTAAHNGSSVPPRQVVAGPAARVLHGWDKAGCNLAVWQRRLPAGLATMAVALRASLGQPLIVSGPRERIASLVAEALADRVGGAFLPIARDVGRLAAVFAATVAETHLRATIEAVAHDQCRYFHVDRVTCRLITTYAGPGTVWVENRGARRDALGSGDNAAIAPDPQAVHALAAGWVAILRGDGPANRGNGLVHRSPPVEAVGARRLVARIDPIDCAESGDP